MQISDKMGHNLKVINNSFIEFAKIFTFSKKGLTLQTLKQTTKFIYT